MIKVILAQRRTLVLTNAEGIKVITARKPGKVVVGGTGSPGSSARTGASLNFEGPWADGQELGGFYAPGDDTYVSSFCKAHTDAAPSSDVTITIKKNGSPFGSIFYPASGLPVVSFLTSGAVAFRDLLQFFAPDPANDAFAASSILYILLAGR